MSKFYKEVDGMNFSKDTPDEVCQALLTAYKNHKRVRVYYGSRETGESYLDIYNVTGYVGKSTGRLPIPLMISNSRSTGGPAIADNLIVKIQYTQGATLYQHPKFFIPEISCEGRAVKKGTDNFAVCETPKQAERMCAFLQGRRMTL